MRILISGICGFVGSTIAIAVGAAFLRRNRGCDRIYTGFE